MDLPVTREAIAAALDPLLGLPLHHWGRAADMAEIGFGDVEILDYGQGPVAIETFIFHVQCAWRIVRDGQILVGDGDYDFPPIDAEFEPSGRRRTRRDDLEAQFQAHDTHTVEGVESFATGDFRLVFDDGCQFETFASTAQRPDVEREAWRLMDRESGKHFVVSAEGIWISDDK